MINIEHDPEKNPKAISIVQDPDGNWRGWMRRFGKIVTAREISPEAVLQSLLTNSGDVA